MSFRIIRETGPTLVAYGCGAIGTVVGAVVAYAVLPLGDVGWQLAGIFCATYIGGAINFAATAEVVGLRSGNLLTAGVAADNLMMMLVFFGAVCPTIDGVAATVVLEPALPPRPESCHRAHECLWEPDPEAPGAPVI